MSLDEVLFHLKEYNPAYVTIGFAPDFYKLKFSLEVRLNDGLPSIFEPGDTIEECLEKALAELEKRKAPNDSAS
jgi:hypothetical protein